MVSVSRSVYGNNLLGVGRSLMEHIEKRRQTALIACFIIFLGFGIGSSVLRLTANGIAKWGSNPLAAGVWAPHDWQIQWAVSLNQFRRQDCDGAILSLRRALRTFPSYWAAKNNLAICYAFVGKLEDAKKEWEGILRQWPYHEEARKNLKEISKTVRRKR